MVLLHKMFAKPCFTGWNPFLPWWCCRAWRQQPPALLACHCLPTSSSTFSMSCSFFPPQLQWQLKTARWSELGTRNKGKGLILFQTRTRDCVNFLCADSTVIKLKAKYMQPSVITQNFHSSAFLLETRSELGLWFTSSWQQQQPHHEATSHRAQELLLFKDSSLSTEKSFFFF